MKKFTQKIYSTALLLLVSVTGFGQVNVWTGDENSYWNTPSNWSLNAIPDLDTDVSIPMVTSGNYPVITGEDGIADCRDITVDAGASVIVNSGGNGTLRIGGGIFGDGEIDATNGSITMIGILPQSITADEFTDNSIRNLTIYNLTGVSLNGNLNLTGLLTLEVGVFNTNNQLTLKSNAATTALVEEVTAGSITGQVTVERYIPARRAFRFMSSPTTGGTIYSNWQEGGSEVSGNGTHITGPGGEANGFDVSGSNNPSLFTHNNMTSEWEPVTNTDATTLTAGEPYRLFVRGDRTIDLTDNEANPTNTTLRTTGTLVTGTVLVNDLSMSLGAFSLVGNPYQAPVDMQAVLAESVNVNTDYYYVWDPTLNARGSYVTVDVETNTNSIEGSEADRYLQPNHAFFVQTQLIGPASLTFREEHKYIVSTDNQEVYRTENETAAASIRLTMHRNEALAEGGAAADGFVIRFNDAYSNTIDGKDAEKPVNQDENVGVLNAGTTLSYESRSMPTVADVIPITNTQYRTTDYTYSIKVTALTGATALLLDKYEGTATELANDATTTYSFSIDETAPESMEQNRFDIIFQETAMNMDEFTRTGITVYPNPVVNNEFTILTENAEQSTVTLYNQIGQQINCSTSVSQNAINVQPAIHLATGIYIAQVTNNGKTETQKLIVK